MHIGILYVHSIHLYLLMRSSIGVKNGTEPIALNALSSRLQGRKRFFSAAGVFLPVTFVASTSPSHVSNSRTPREWGRAPGAEYVSFSVHDTRNFFSTDICAFPRVQWTIDHLCTTCTRLFSILISRVDPGQRAKVPVSKVKKTFRLLRLDIDSEYWLIPTSYLPLNSKLRIITSNNHVSF